MKDTWENIIANREIKLDHNAGELYFETQDMDAFLKLKEYWNLGIGTIIQFIIERTITMNNDLYRTLIEKINQPISIIQVIFNEIGDPVDYITLYMNAASETQLGINREKIIGRRAKEISPNAEQEWFKRYGEVVKTGISVSFERHSSTFNKYFNNQVIPLGNDKIALLFQDITEVKVKEEAKKNAIEALRESEAKYRSIFETAQEGIWVINGNDQTIMINEKLQQMLGYTLDELLGQSPQSFMAPEFKVAANDRLIKHMGGEKQIIDYRFIKKDGSSLWCILSSTPLFDKNGKFDGSIAMITDITDRKRMEEALRESKEKYHNLFESMDEGYCIIEVLFDDNNSPLDYRFLEVNQAFERQTGLVDATGRYMREMAPDHEQHWFDIYGRVALTGEPIRFQNPADALGFFYDVYAFRIGEPEQRRVAILFNDIGPRKQAEDALHKSKERQTFLLKLSDALRPITDALEIQRTAMRIVGEYLEVDCVMYNEITDDGNTIHIEDNYVRNGFQKITGDFPVSSFGSAMEVLRQGEILIIDDQTKTPLKKPKEKKASTTLQVYASATAPLIKHGRWVANFGILHGNPRKWTKDEMDILQETAERTWAAVERALAEKAQRESERKATALVAELEKADQNKNAFINMLSHELRNPLASIMISLDLMDKLIPEGQRNYKALEIAKRQGKQLTNLVDDLLDVTRISQNKIALKKETVEINELINKAVQDYQPQFIDKNVKLEIKLTTPLFLEADPSRITQVIGNLLHNAGKFTRSNDLVTTTVSPDTNSNEAVITVQDTGRGIDTDVLGNLFEPFTQVDKTLDRSNGGLGLGLAIVKGMVELHGGRVEAFSEGVGKGAKFTIRLPLPKGNVRIQEFSEKPDDKSNKSLKILIIDDNKDLAEILCELIGFLGYETGSAHNGTDGIAKAIELRPDIIICDIGLPDMSGYEVAKMIRQDAELKDTFMIALSGYAQSEDIERSKEAGFNRHLAKPVSIETLEIVLKDVK